MRYYWKCIACNEILTTDKQMLARHRQTDQYLKVLLLLHSPQYLKRKLFKTSQLHFLAAHKCSNSCFAATFMPLISLKFIVLCTCILLTAVLHVQVSVRAWVILRFGKDFKLPFAIGDIQIKNNALGTVAFIKPFFH